MPSETPPIRARVRLKVGLKCNSKDQIHFFKREKTQMAKFILPLGLELGIVRISGIPEIDSS